ncbi:MAG: PTS sugar transporter subunit IIA [Clostridiales bacterium]|nr:PTS sugar transporter subunit IIA [Clostridiales bacterium]
MSKINSRHNNILHDIVNKQYKSLVDYSEEFDVSQRTIRNDIKEMNEALTTVNHQPVIINDNGKLCFKNEEVDKKLIDSLFDDKNFYTYKLTPNERKTILAMVLLNSDSYKTIANLSEQTFMSRNTLLNDLDELKGWFFENSMELTPLRRRGFMVLGSEKNVREGMLKLLLLNGDMMLREDNDKNAVFHRLLLQELDKDNIFHEIEYILEEMEEKNDLCLADFSYREVSFYLLIMVYRLMKNNELASNNKIDWSKLKKSSKYNMTIELMETLSQKYNFPILPQETAELLENLRSKSYIKNNSKRIDMIDIQILINEFIYKISVELQINYYLDFYLYDLLVAHMKTAVHRLEQGHSIENPLLPQLQSMYPYVFDEVKKYLKSLEGYIKYQFTLDEISFVVMYIVSIMEKNKTKVKALIVCNSGQGTAQLISARLQSMCKQIQIMNVISSHNLKGINQEDIDIIISTVPLRNIDLPMIQVSPILTDGDLYNIQSMIMKLQDEKQKYTKGYEEKNTEQKPNDETLNDGTSFHSDRKFIDILSLNRIKLDIEAEDWQDAVKKAGEVLYNDQKINSNYIKAMIDNIKKNGPYVVIYPGIAIPHAESTDGSREVAASIIRLKNPVHFHHDLNDPVKFVIALSVVDSESIDRPLYNLTKMLGEKTFVEAMNEVSTEEQLFNIFSTFENAI